MDIDRLLKRLDAQEDQIKSLKKTITSLSNQIAEHDEAVLDLSKSQKVTRKNLDQVSASIIGLGKFDASLSQIRIDFNKTLEEQEKIRKQGDAYREKIRQDDQLAQIKAIEKLRSDLQADLEHKIHTFIDESQKTMQRIKEMEHNIGKGLRSEEAYRDTINAIQQTTNQQSKKIQSIEADSKSISEALDKVWPKIELLMDQLRKNESRLVEIQSIETQRRQEYFTAVEQQNLRQLEFSRQFKEWHERIDDVYNRSKTLLEEYPPRIAEITSAQQNFNEINERIERRINEITEMYRLLDERIRQNWDTYKAEDQKKWAGITLLSGERQESLINQSAGMKERLSQIEDTLYELQSIVNLMNNETQKGMQSLMKMVNGWIETLEQIRSNSQNIKP